MKPHRNEDVRQEVQNINIMVSSREPTGTPLSCGRLTDDKTNVALSLPSSAASFLVERHVLLGLLPTPKLNVCSPRSNSR